MIQPLDKASQPPLVSSGQPTGAWLCTEYRSQPPEQRLHKRNQGRAICAQRVLQGFRQGTATLGASQMSFPSEGEPSAGRESESLHPAIPRAGSMLPHPAPASCTRGEG